MLLPDSSLVRAPHLHPYRRTSSGALLTLLALLVGACSDGQGSEIGEGGPIEFRISGEELATDGFRFPTGSEVTVVDGWEIRFEHVLVTVGNLTLSENPDRDPSDQSQTGRRVARVSGPWAVDLAQDGDLPGAGGEGTALRLATIDEQNENGGEPFDPEQRYAVSFEIVPAEDDAERLGFDSSRAEDAYQEMIDEEYTVLLVGEARFRGTDCQTSADYDFTVIPETVPFRLGFRTPTAYLNCQNQENQGDPFPDEEYQRGIPITQNRTSVAQITLHLDHPFYSDLEHEPALYFDQMAARLVGAPEATLTLDSLRDLDPTAFTDAAGEPLPWRTCDGSEVRAQAQRRFDLGTVPLNPAASPAQALRDYADYVQYTQSAQAHLNGGEGLCFIDRKYPSPP